MCPWTYPVSDSSQNNKTVKNQKLHFLCVDQASTLGSSAKETTQLSLILLFKPLCSLFSQINVL